jgi:hypothetical protein
MLFHVFSLSSQLQGIMPASRANTLRRDPGSVGRPEPRVTVPTDARRRCRTSSMEGTLQSAQVVALAVQVLHEFGVNDSLALKADSFKVGRAGAKHRICGFPSYD